MKVSILAGSVAAMASLVVGSLIVNGSADIVYQNGLNRLKYETNIKSARLLSDIKNLRDDAKYLVGSPPIMGIPRAIKNNGVDPLDNSALETWQNRLATIFTELIRAKSNYLQIRYIGVSDVGRELLRVDRRGTAIKTIPKSELQQKGNTLYFNNAIKINPGEVYLSDVTLNKELNKISEPYTPVIRAATPVFFEGKLFGILVINMELGKIFNTLIKNTPRELIPYVTNEDGYFLAHPNKTMTFGFDLGHEHKIQTTYHNFDLSNNIDLRDIELTVKTKNNVVHVVKAHFDPMKEERYFAVMLATSYKNLQSASDNLRYQSLIIMSILVVISLIIAAVLASRLMRPLKLISIASDDLACGRDVSNLPVKSRDEIGELARSFEAMHRQLEDKERELIVTQGLVHHSNKMASLGEMAGSIAHEINSPMQSINLIAQRVQRQLKKNISAEDIDASMTKITNSVHKISEIIDSLRKTSRGSTDDEFFDISLGELVDDIINMTGERFKVTNVKFQVNYHNASKNSLIQCQRLQISQVLINLINNAYDATQSEKDKWISIDFYKTNEKIIISITDSGKGIAIDIIDRIFEPMFTTKEIGKGTGLGLSISNEIILKHNGLFYVDKDADNTRFVIELPIIHLAS